MTQNLEKRIELGVTRIADVVPAELRTARQFAIGDLLAVHPAAVAVIAIQNRPPDLLRRFGVPDLLGLDAIYSADRRRQPRGAA